MQNKVVRLPANAKGRDLIFGDIHGCFDQFELLLAHLKFDSENDRVFFVGDLVDRGPESMKSLELVFRPNHYSVLGNHEDMMFAAVLDSNWNQYDTWMYNGGKWATPLLAQNRGDFLLRLTELRDKFPYVIVVGDGFERYNIVHAELCSFSRMISDADIDNWTFNKYEENSAVWGRDMIRYVDTDWPTFQYNMSTTYCGHTPLQKVVAVRSQIYLDTGCVYAVLRKGSHTDNGLTVACHQEGKYWTLHPSDDNRISEGVLPSDDDIPSDSAPDRSSFV